MRMLGHRKLWWTAVALLFVGTSFLVLPTYGSYCNGDYANNYYCAAYSVVIALGHAVQKYNGAITAIATFFIFIFTGTLYSTSRNQLRFSRKVERAYVSGGVSIDWRDTDKTEAKASGIGYVVSTVQDPYWLHVVLSNHGKTPAHANRIAFSSCRDDELPAPASLEADYSRSDHHLDEWISPGEKDRPINIGFDFQIVSGRIVYGRVWYTDIFGDSHSSGFIARVYSRSIGSYRADSPEYTAWD
jgi:hypothetical protein